MNECDAHVRHWQWEQWRAGLLSDVDITSRHPGTGKTEIIVGGRAIDRIDDPTLSLRVLEAIHGDQAARALLYRTYREALSLKRKHHLPLDARLFVESLIQSNGGKMPASRKGRPKAPHRAFALAAAVAVERKRGLTIPAAIDAVIAGHAVPRSTVEKAHKAWGNSPAMSDELLLRQYAVWPRERPPVDLRALDRMEPPPLSKPPRHKIR